MPHPLFWHNKLDGPVTLPDIQQALRDLSPYLTNIQHSFSNKTTPLYQWLLLVVAIIVIIIAINAIFKYRPSRKRVGPSPQGGEDMFNSMLAHLDLTAFDTALLRQVAQETRLRHPSVFLLSPDMFNWSKKIWIQEKGTQHVTGEKITQLEAISQKLFGPSSHSYKSAGKNV
jgi:hypothetical protein